VQEISRRDATVASRREISYTRLLIREPLNKETPPGGGGSCDQRVRAITHPCACVTTHYNHTKCMHHDTANVRHDSLTCGCHDSRMCACHDSLPSHESYDSKTQPMRAMTHSRARAVTHSRARAVTHSRARDVTHSRVRATTHHHHTNPMIHSQCVT